MYITFLYREKKSKAGLEKRKKFGGGWHSADIRKVLKEIDDLRASGRRDRRDRGILSNKLLLRRKGSACVCVYVSVCLCECVCMHGELCVGAQICVDIWSGYVCVCVYKPACISKQVVCACFYMSVCVCTQIWSTETTLHVGVLQRLFDEVACCSF